MNNAQLWASIYDAVELSVAARETWIAPLALVSVEQDRLTVAAQRDFDASIVGLKYAKKLGEAASRLLKRPVRVRVVVDGNINQDLSDLNKPGSSNLIPPLADRSSLKNSTDLSNLNASAVKNPNKLTNQALAGTPALLRLLEWGIDKPMLFVWADDHGIQEMCRESNRLEKLPDGFFNPKYGPIHTQKGRFFNNHMQKLRKQKQERGGYG